MTHVQCMVLIPAGPATVREYLDDTIDSINQHMRQSNCTVALLDDSREGRFDDIAGAFSNVVVVKAADYHEGTRTIKRGSLFSKEIHALKQLMERHRFDILLKMDTDALIIGDSPQREVLAFMERHPHVGMVGAFRRRGDGSDKASAMASKGRVLGKEMRLRSGFRNLALTRTLRRLVRRAEEHGYTRGDTCTGGAYFVSSSAVQSMLRNGFLDLSVLRYSKLSEDSLMALLCCACGYGLSDLPEDSDVLAINWRGLPMPLEALVARNKKIVHPIKDSDTVNEADVRAYFRERRGGSEACGPTGSAAAARNSMPPAAAGDGYQKPYSTRPPANS